MKRVFREIDNNVVATSSQAESRAKSKITTDTCTSSDKENRAIVHKSDSQYSRKRKKSDKSEKLKEEAKIQSWFDLNDYLEFTDEFELSLDTKYPLLKCSLKTNCNERELLVDWMIYLHLRLHIEPEILHLSVTLLDVLLSKINVSSNDLQSAGAASILLAWKFYDAQFLKMSKIQKKEHERSRFPFPSSCLYHLDHVLRLGTSERPDFKNKVLYYEREILKMCDFNLIFPNVLTLLKWHISKIYGDHVNMMVYCAASYILEIMLMRDDLMSTRPSIRTLTAIRIALELFENEQVVKARSRSKALLEIAIEDFKSKIMEVLRYTNSVSQYFYNTAVYTKYSQKTFYSIAKHPKFLL